MARRLAALRSHSTTYHFTPQASVTGKSLSQSTGVTDLPSSNVPGWPRMASKWGAKERFCSGLGVR